MNIKGKLALITGASSGIGEASRPPRVSPSVPPFPHPCIDLGTRPPPSPTLPGGNIANPMPDIDDDNDHPRAR